MRTQAQNPLAIAPSCPPAIGSKLDDRYQLTRLLASGSRGLVYEGVDMFTGFEAAVKLFPSWVFRGEARERFLREVERFAAVGHPNLVRYLSFGLIGERSPFVAMERLRGVTLRARLRQVGFLPVRNCLRILREVLLGLAAAHAEDVTHGNIRPESVFLDRRRGAVLFDFGITLDASVLEQLALAGSDSVSSGDLPPRALAAGTSDCRYDLYCFSLMAYEMLTGRRPEDSDGQRLRPRPPSKLQFPIGSDVDQWVMRGLAEDPSARFATAEEMGASCERLLDRLGG